jgi:D-alanyl-D-alanine carboxypeptidase (penicillin-binding protein 5/6)
VLRRLTSVRAALTLTALVLVLVSGSSGWDRAISQEKATGKHQTATTSATPGQPKLKAKAWALVDADTGLYLAGKNTDERLPIASVGNVMLALVALDEGVDLDEEVTVSRQAERFVGVTYSNVGLIRGERLSVRDLLVATLVPSGTDAAYVLAKSLGGGSVERFVEKMNAKADSMGLENTHFSNPAGLDSPGTYSSARDLTKIVRAAMEHPVFAGIVAKEQATISTNNRKIQVFTTNNLLYAYQNATGVKTGTSAAAGPCLAASAEEGDESYIAVILDAKDTDYRFEAAQQMLEFGFDKYERQALVHRGEVYERSPVPYRPGESVGLTAVEDVAGLAGPGLKIERRVTTGETPAKAEAGQKLGTIKLVIGGQSIGSSPLVAKRGYEEASLWAKARYALLWPAERLWSALQSYR